jgi:hypothetical protein
MNDLDKPILQTAQPLLSYEVWKSELIALTAMKSGREESRIKINDEGAKQWWKDGFTPYATFRETYSNILPID